MSHSINHGETTTKHKPRSYRGGLSSLKAGVSQVLGIGKVASRLGPKQIKDELQIAKLEMKDKGIKLGVGAAFVVVGLVFLLFAVIALITAAIAGLATVMPLWLSALLFAALFIVLLAIFALIGLLRIKSQLPLKPESAIFGFLYDLGVAKEGSSYTSSRVRREMKEKEEAKAEEKRQAKEEKKRQKRSNEVPETPQPSQDQLEQRTKARRDHLKSLRDDFGQQFSSVQSSATGLAEKSSEDAKSAPDRAKVAASNLGANVSDPDNLKARWKPLTALAVSVGAFFVFLGRLFKK
ncbi:phage holin family protein [Kocuria sp. HSID16901]|uniref:phage holin family protein n=1 Tax=Kocuria sp. HSID16901 TaxID=2419505 RepID=UPI0006610795|nr:phage holin family protein [Kocuria sp. HSID16901]RUQ21166.1 phage holin family protein [Kocuria sp. HSID16901]